MKRGGWKTLSVWCNTTKLWSAILLMALFLVLSSAFRSWTRGMPLDTWCFLKPRLWTLKFEACLKCFRWCCGFALLFNVIRDRWWALFFPAFQLLFSECKCMFWQAEVYLWSRMGSHKRMFSPVCMSGTQ